MSIFLTSLSTFSLIFRPFPAPHGFPVSARLTGVLAVSHPSVVPRLITDRVAGIAPSGDRTRVAKRGFARLLGVTGAPGVQEPGTRVQSRTGGGLNSQPQTLSPFVGRRE